MHFGITLSRRLSHGLLATQLSIEAACGVVDSHVCLLAVTLGEDTAESRVWTHERGCCLLLLNMLLLLSLLHLTLMMMLLLFWFHMLPFLLLRMCMLFTIAMLRLLFLFAPICHGIEGRRR